VGLVAVLATALGTTLTFTPSVAGAADRARRGTPAFATAWDGHGHLRVIRYDLGPVRDAVAALTTSDPGLDVVTAERDGTVHALGGACDQWALNATTFRAAWSYTKGAGVTVAVVDTGVRASHEDLIGKVLPGKDYINPSGDGRSDPNGHGTHVAGIIASAFDHDDGFEGGAPAVRILPVRVLDGNGSGSSSDVADGIIWAVDHGARVVNLSLGGDASNGTRTAIQYANAHGAVVVAAAGNNGDSTNRTVYPAAYPEAIAVAAVDQYLGHASFSNHGAYVDVSAPGVAIASTYGSSNTATACMSGTSMATPYAAAEAALVVATNPRLSAEQIATDIEVTARDLGAAGPDAYFGHGLINPRSSVTRAIPKPAGYGTKGNGYWVVTADGRVRAYGRARSYGDLSGHAPGAPIVASAVTKTGKGYWLASADGAVYAFGDAHYYGSMAGRHLNSPIAGMAVDPAGRGYLLLAADGGIFTFGHAHFAGSTGAMRLKAPVLDMTMAPSGRGYWMVAADGGVFSFGDAKFRGSTGSLRLASPVVSMTAGSRGYWLVARDGGIFAFGVPFVGSLPQIGVASTVAGARIRALPDGKGYYILRKDGAVFTFGTAKFFGSAAPLGYTPAIDLMLMP
jgi:type VII secretion-associated serine protease mycosin